MVGMSPKTFYIYIITNEPRGTLYVGVTSQLLDRIFDHRGGRVEGFSKTYRLNRLVYFELQPDAESAFRREKNLKRWRRDWKFDLIEKANPTWRDLYDDVVIANGFEP